MTTKADTLTYLASHLEYGVIDSFFVFTVRDWLRDKKPIVDNIVANCEEYRYVVIRSSTVNEDQPASTFAGYFHSELDVPSCDRHEIEDAVERVTSSYSKNGRSMNLDDQIIVQGQVEDIIVSGVLLNYDIRLHSPYYLINYDSSTGATNAVTSGAVGQAVRIARWLDISMIPEMWHGLLLAAEEIELFYPGYVVDIEFGITPDEKVHIFQVRTIGNTPDDLQSTRFLGPDDIAKLRDQIDHQLRQIEQGLPGCSSVLADMSDWNPAEIIGSRPSPLSLSLYQYLVTESAWNTARISMGYSDVSPHPLMVTIGDKPYIDLRVSFNSLTPAFITGELRSELINSYLQKIRRQPELQDKVEFEIVLTCYDVTFPKRVQELLPSLSREHYLWLSSGLAAFTNRLLESAELFLRKDRQSIQMLDERRAVLANAFDQDTPLELRIHRIGALLQDCRDFGVVPFARQARMAFVGLTLLRSFAREGALSWREIDEFLSTIDTVAKSLTLDHHALSRGFLTLEDFLSRYGHLRPGTYDITAPRYLDSPDLFTQVNDDYLATPGEKPTFKLEDSASTALNQLLREHGLGTSATQLLSTIRQAIENREDSKFEFTKSLSQVLEDIAKVGKEIGLSREEMQYLDIDMLLQQGQFQELSGSRNILEAWRAAIQERQTAKLEYRKIALPPIISASDDILIAPYYESAPNFVTRKRVEGEAIYLSRMGTRELEIAGKIVMLESADPGYDWLFTRRIQGLVTQYGGAASHMAIRCAELEVPAAIGCGELLFNQLKAGHRIILDADAEIVSSIA